MVSVLFYKNACTYCQYISLVIGPHRLRQFYKKYLVLLTFQDYYCFIEPRPMNVMIFLLLTLNVCQSFLFEQKSDPLAQYQWKNRLIIINTNSEKALEQLKVFEQAKEQLIERDLILIQLSGNEVYVNDRQTTLHAHDIRRNLAIGEKFECLLIGKDGGVKSRSTEVKDPAYFFSLIDQMPMRQSEIKKSVQD